MAVKQSDRAFATRPVLWGLICLAAIALTCAKAAFAQQDASSPQTQAQTQAQTSKPPSPAERLPPVALYNFLQKKSVVFPDIALSAVPLSPGQKFQLFVDNSFSVHTITWATLGSAVGQANNSPTGFGQGWDAYAKRFGSSMGRQASSQFFGTFVLASVLHHDPRFFPEVNPGFFHAVKYSVQRVFVLRNDQGHDVANISGLGGSLMAEGLANVYWPDRNRTVGDTFFRFGLDIATRAGGNMLREYWPVFYGKITRASRPPAGHN
jgi:hypothetical protein